MKWVWTWVILSLGLAFIANILRSIDFKGDLSVAIFGVIIIIITTVGSLWLLQYVWELNII